MNRLDRFFDNYLKEFKEEENLEQGVVWEEEPITFDEFVKSKEHMAFPPYSERQLEGMQYLFGLNPKNSFNNEISLLILQYGKGAGKDTICCHAVLYCVYLLLCCKNPYKLFRGIDATSYMDIVNVAYNIQQARDVFFTKLVEAIKSWKWLRERYKYIESGKSKKIDKKYVNEDIVNIKADEIRFPKKIRALVKCSQAASVEGLNVLLWILDEFSAFSDKNNKSNAMEMFNTLKSSSVTRFGNQSKGFVISFPRYKDDPIQKLSKMYEDDLGTYIDKASTFEVKPKSCFCDKWVEWKGRMIPEDFLSEFTRDPENALAKYFCEPPEMSDPYFTEVSKIDACVDENKKPILEVRGSIVESNGEKLYRNEIIHKNYDLPETNFVLGGDIGLTNDLSSISLWHSETSYLGNNQSITYYVQDLKIDWIPDKSKGIKVDTENVDKIIEEIIWKYKIPVINVYFDHFNTALILQKLRNRGVNGQAYVLTVQDFYDIRTKIYDGRVKFLNDQEQILEIKRLRNTTSGKPDHVEDGHDDRFRASCLAIVALSGGGKNAAITSNDDGIYINKKLNPEEGMSDMDFEAETVRGNFHNGGVVDEDNDPFDNYFDL